MVTLGIFTAVSATFPVMDPTLLSTLEPQSLESLAHSFGYWKTSSSHLMEYINANANAAIPTDNPDVSEVSSNMKAYINKMGHSFEVPVNKTTIREFDKVVELGKNKIVQEYRNRLRR